MNTLPKVGEIYYHYKYFTENNPVHVYEIIGLAGNAHNNNYEEKWVVYKNIKDKTFTQEQGIDCYIRPLAEFLEEIEIDGQKRLRFQLKSATV